MDSERSPLLFPRAVGSGNASPEDDNESGESSAQTPKSFGYREVIVLFSIGILVFIQGPSYFVQDCSILLLFLSFAKITLHDLPILEPRPYASINIDPILICAQFH